MNKIETVSKMQEYIKIHIKDENFSLSDLYTFIGYTQRHCVRLFKDVLGITPSEYIKLIRLSKSAEELTKNDKSILSVAINNGFQTHEGFSRSFKNKFSISPKDYRDAPCPIPLFIQYPANHYYILKNKNNKVEKESLLCAVTVTLKPARKIIFKRAKRATGYLSYCEEKDCDWEGLLNSINEKLDTAAIIELPDHLLKPGYSNIAAGVEVPVDYSFIIPEYETAKIEETLYLCFQSETYENENDFNLALACVDEAIRTFDCKQFSCAFTKDKFPSFNYGSQKEIGARAAIPIELTGTNKK